MVFTEGLLLPSECALLAHLPLGLREEGGKLLTGELENACWSLVTFVLHFGLQPKCCTFDFSYSGKKKKSGLKSGTFQQVL